MNDNYTAAQIREHRQLWYDALMSEDYKQGHNCLLSDGDGRYCCLGVAEVVMCIALDLKIKWIGVYLDRDSNTALRPEYNTGDGLALSLKCQQWLGFNNSNPVIPGNSTYTFADLNDKLGLSFKKIAKIIKKEYIDEI